MDTIKCKNDIAIILGVYNGEKYIAKQLESVIDQTFTDWRLYIRDDASVDNTPSIIRSFSEKDSRIVLIQDELGNLGCNGNYFELLKKIDANYYMFCNADDYWYKDKIEISFNKMKEVEAKYSEKPIIIHTDLSIGDEDLNIINESHWKDWSYNPELFKSYNYLGVTNMCAGATMLLNKKARDNAFPECGQLPFFDHWLALQNINKGLIVTIYTPTMIYRQVGINLALMERSDQLGLRNKIKNIKQVIKVNYHDAKLMKEIGWGGYIKYIYYKLLLTLKTRMR